MFARSTTMTADLSDPTRLEAGIAYVRDEVMPQLLGMDGCVGLSLMVDRATGRCITTAAWQDLEVMRASDATVQGLRGRAAEIFNGTPSVDVWEIVVFHRMEQAGSGACVRATWTHAELVGIDRAVEAYRATLLPAIEQLPGFRSASLFVDRNTGRSVSSVTYADRAAMEANRQAASELRRSAVQENQVQVLQMGEFELALAHLRVPELV